jgi:hypothetical protein
MADASLTYEPCYLIDEATFRAHFARVSPNLSFDELAPAFRLAHDMDVRPLLGDACLQQLCNALQGPDPDAIELALLAELRPWLAWAIGYRLLELRPDLQLDPAGLLRRAAEGTTPADFKALRDLMQLAGHRAAYYRRRLWQWLAEHKADFPCLPDAIDCGPGGGWADVPWGSVHF